MNGKLTLCKNVENAPGQGSWSNQPAVQPSAGIGGMNWISELFFKGIYRYHILSQLLMSYLKAYWE